MRQRSSTLFATLSMVALGACASTPAPAPEAVTPPATQEEPEAEEPAVEPETESSEDEGSTSEGSGGSGGTSSELDASKKAALSDTIRGYLPDLQECYEPELAKNPKLSGKMTYTLTVERTGSVRGVNVDVDTVEDEKVRACTVGQIEQWQFDGSQLEEPADVTFSVAFKAV